VTHGSIFSGIGGFDLAARWMGWENVFHVERDPFCREVLAHHFPESQAFDDVKTFDATPFRGRIRVLSGGFPCQPFSAAGKRAGTSDDRYLWPEMFRIIREARPTYVVAENVRGLISWNEGLVLETVCADLEGEGYEVFPVVLPAAGVNAPHRRDRIWIVAYRDNSGSRNPMPTDRDGTQEIGQGFKEFERGAHGFYGDAPHANGAGARQDNGKGESGQPDQTRPPTDWQDFPTVPPVCGGDDGLPQRLDGITFSKWRRESIKAYGNAIVPQVAYQIFQALDT
jgi:DNA (cytosine-5)-methyltransferase 1